jgi:hypothetical protein
MRTQVPIGSSILTALLGSIHITGCVLTFSCERGQIFRLDVVSHV